MSAAVEGKTPDRRAFAMETYTRNRLRLAEARALATGAVRPAPATTYQGRRERMTKEERDAEDKREQSEMIRFFTLMMVCMSVVMGLVALIGWMVAVSMTAAV